MDTKTIILKGISRNPYTFTVSPWGAALPSTSSVYAVLKWQQPGYSVLYIGSSGDIYSVHPEPDEGLADDERRDAFIREGCSHVGVHVEPVVSRRLAKVTDLTASYAPILNGLGELKGEVLFGSE